MARPLKTGLDYFPLDTVFDDKIDILETECGLEGFAIFIKLLQRIYRNGYYYQWNGREEKLLSGSINVDINVVSGVVNVCINENIFNKGIYEKYHILTSAGIQKRFFNAVCRRKSIDIITEYILIDINVYINPAQTTLMSTSCIQKPRSAGINVDISTQSKVKESKVKKILKKEVVPKTEPSVETSVFKKAQALMEEIHGETYLNYEKEMPCLKRFIEQISKKMPEDPWKLIEPMIYQFAEMKQNDRTAKGYWRDMDFAPSKLVAHAEIIYEKLKSRTKKEKLSIEDRELIHAMFGK